MTTTGTQNDPGSSRVPEPPAYSIGVLARILGVSEAMLRKWENRYRIVVPQRNPAGHRLYSRLQAQQLQFVCDQVALGRTRGEAFRLLQDCLANDLPLEGAKGIPSDSPTCVLLVDPDTHAAGFSEYFLRQLGHEVAVTTTIKQAIAEIRHVAPDLAIIDLLASDGQGLQLCGQLRQQLDIPILAVSILNLRAEAMGAGAAGFLLKPIQPRRLVTVVQHLLSQRSPTTDRSRMSSLTS